MKRIGIVQLEGTFKDRVQLCHLFRANQQSKHVIEGDPNALLSTDRHGVSTTSLSKKIVPVFDHPHSTEAFPHAQSETPQHSFILFPHVLSLVPWEQNLAPPSGLPLHRTLQRATGSPLSLLLRAGQPWFPQPLLTGHAFQPFYQFYCPPLDALNLRLSSRT